MRKKLKVNEYKNEPKKGGSSGADQNG